MNWIRHSHCSFCGTRFADGQAWPRHCQQCEQISYLNPLPVAVTLLPVDKGVLLVRRAIPPRAGQLALPGGFIDRGESWQAAGARELFEETGIQVDPAGITHFDTLSAPDGTVLIFGRAAPLTRAQLPPFRLSPETSEILIAEQPLKLAFPLHTDVVTRYLASL